MSSESTLREQQREFARCVRSDDTNVGVEGVTPRRLAVYRELVANNISTLLAANFPVIRKTLADDAWQALIHGFLRGHQAETPLFTSIGQEFIRYLDALANTGDPPWLVELAHWEWLELAAQIAPAITTLGWAGFDPDGELLTRIPVIDPGVQIAAYRWPVHRIGPGFIPKEEPEQPTLLMARRDATGQVHFSELSPLLYRMLDWLDDEDPPSGELLIGQLLAEAQPPDHDAFRQEALAMLQRLRSEGVVRGSRPHANAACSPP